MVEGKLEFLAKEAEAIARLQQELTGFLTRCRARDPKLPCPIVEELAHLRFRRHRDGGRNKGGLEMNTSSEAAHSGRALLLIDFQRDFLEADGRMPVARAQVSPVLRAAAEALANARKSGDLVVAIGNEFRPGDLLMNLLRRHASIAGSPGAQWTEKLPIAGVPYFPKWAESAFVNPDLDAWLRDHEVKTLTLAGLKANACISSTAKEALRRGYKVQLLADAIACGSDRSRARALARLQGKGVALLRAAA